MASKRFYVHDLLHLIEEFIPPLRCFSRPFYTVLKVWGY